MNQALNIKLRYAIACVCSLTAAPTFSQQAAPSARAGGLEEIVVTARKRAENLQEVPVSISVLSSSDLQNKNIEDMRSLSQYLPNVDFAPPPSYGSGGLLITMRGLAANPDGRPYNESSVSVYVDGVVIPRDGQSITNLADVDHIEVLRGPQGTLFGRNTTGGAVNIVTKTPNADAGVHQDLKFGNYNEVLSRTTVNTGKLFDSDFRAKLTYVHKKIDGYIKNTLDQGSGEGPGYAESDGFYAGLYGKMANGLVVDLKADYSRAHDLPGMNQIVAMDGYKVAYFQQAALNAGAAGFHISPFSLASSTADAASYPAWLTSSYGGSATLTLPVTDVVTAKSITGFRGGSHVNHEDLSGGNPNLKGPVFDNSLCAIGYAPPPCAISTQTVTPFTTNVAPAFITGHDITNPAGQQFQSETDHNFSEELQLVADWDTVKLTTGLYFFNEVIHNIDPYAFTLVFPTTVTDQTPLGLAGVNAWTNQHYTIDSKSYAGFLTGSWAPEAFDKKLEVTGGLRYTKDKKHLYDMSQSYIFFPAPPLDRASDASWNFTNFNTSVSYKWTPDVLTYVRVADGTKSGGFSPGGAVVDEYKPEKDKLYEGGVRSEWLDHRLLLNLTVFKTDYTDQQVQNFNGTSSTVNNAGKSHSNGLEFDGRFVPDAHWDYTASMGYTDAKFDEFPYTPVAGGPTLNVASTSHMPFAPKVTAHVGVTYTYDEIAYGLPSVSIDYAYKASWYTYGVVQLSPYANVLESPSSKTVNINVALANMKIGSNKARVNFYGNNVTNEHPLVSAIDLGALGYGTATYGRGATYGVNLSIDF